MCSPTFITLTLVLSTVSAQLPYWCDFLGLYWYTLQNFSTFSHDISWDTGNPSLQSGDAIDRCGSRMCSFLKCVQKFHCTAVTLLFFFFSFPTHRMTFCFWFCCFAYRAFRCVQNNMIQNFKSFSKGWDCLPTVNTHFIRLAAFVFLHWPSENCKGT